MKYVHGFNAQTTATAIILETAFIRLPVSTSHVMSTAIMGTGSAQRIRAVKSAWQISGRKIYLSVPLFS